MLSMLLASAALLAPAPAPAPGPAVEGWVLNPKGKPLAATVGLIPASQRASSLAPKSVESLGVPSKKRPGFRLAAPSPGLYLLDVRATGFRPLQLPLLVKEGGVQDLKLSPLPEKAKGEVKPVTEDARALAWMEIYQGLKGRETRFLEAFKTAREKNEKPKLDLAPDLAALEKALKEEPDADTQAFRALAYLNTLFQGAKLEPATAAFALEKLPAGSPFWSLSPRLAMNAYPAAGKFKEAEAFRDALIRENPDRDVRAAALFSRLAAASRAGDTEKAKADFATLAADYKGTEAARAARQFDPEGALAKGKAFPAFQLKDLEGQELSLDRYKGKLLLVDFWATWCGPCKAEMPELHAVHAKYKASGFEILSLSLDQKAEDVTAFRADAAHPMPWSHAFLGRGSKDPLLQAVRLSTIPRPILVGPDGRVVEPEGMRLRGKYLALSVEKALKELGMLKAPEAPKTEEAPKADETPKAEPAPNAEEPPKA